MTIDSATPGYLRFNIETRTIPKAEIETGKDKEQKEKKKPSRGKSCLWSRQTDEEGKEKEYIFLRYVELHRRSNQRNFQSSSMTFWSGSNVSSSRGRKQATGRQTHTNQDRKEVIIVVLVLDYTRPYRFKVQGFISPCCMHACSMHWLHGLEISIDRSSYRIMQ